jgi:Na+/melibiose symporter-like transporter
MVQLLQKSLCRNQLATSALLNLKRKSIDMSTVKNPTSIFGTVSMIPLLGVLLVIYLLLAITGANFGEGAKSLFTITLMSGAKWAPTIGDLFVIVGTLLMFVETIKSTRSSVISNVENSLSMLVFIIYLVLFIVMPAAGTSTFLVLTLMSLLDALGGFIVSSTAARRDVNVNQIV